MAELVTPAVRRCWCRLSMLQPLLFRVRPLSMPVDVAPMVTVGGVGRRRQRRMNTILALWAS